MTNEEIKKMNSSSKVLEIVGVTIGFGMMGMLAGSGIEDVITNYNIPQKYSHIVDNLSQIGFYATGLFAGATRTYYNFIKEPKENKD